MPSIIRLRSRRLEEVGEKENACEKETRASPLRALVLSFAHYFQAPAMQAKFDGQLGDQQRPTLERNDMKLGPRIDEI